MRPGDVRARSRRLGLQIAVLLVALLAVVGVVAYRLYERAETATAEVTLADAAEHLSPGEEDDGFWVVLERATGRVTTPGLPSGLPDEEDLARVAEDGRARQEEVRAGGRTYFLRTEVRSGGQVVQVAMDRTRAEEASGRLALSLLLAGGVGVLLAAAVAALLARRSLQPVTEALVMQQRFVSDASHELRTPLTLLSTRVQLLSRHLTRRDDLGPGVRADLDGVLADTAALAGVLDELLLAAEPDAGPREPCDLDALVASVVASARASAAEAGVLLEVGSTVGVSVPAAPGAVRRAVTSLVDNALGHARSRVRVDLVAERRQVRVVVTDDGPGVPAEVADSLFERFSGGRTGAPPASGGRRHYGLGLALVSDVASAHGGTVRVTTPSDGTVGSAFVLTLPR